MNANLDRDLESLGREALVAEVKRLRNGIRAHSRQLRPRHHPDLWRLLPEQTHPLPSVPDWPQFLHGCLK